MHKNKTKKKMRKRGKKDEKKGECSFLKFLKKKKNEGYLEAVFRAITSMRPPKHLINQKKTKNKKKEKKKNKKKEKKKKKFQSSLEEYQTSMKS